MPPSAIAPFAIVVILNLFAAGAAVRSIATGRLCLVPVEITRRDDSGKWLMGVIVQVLTAVLMAAYTSRLAAALFYPH